MTDAEMALIRRDEINDIIAHHKGRTCSTTFLLREEATDYAVKDAKDAYKYCSDLADHAQEAFVVLTLNQKNRIIGRHLVSLGSATATLIHPREVFRPAILEGAASVMVVHNHPSGDPTPSSDDRRMTERLVEAAEILGIRLLDHVIIGDNQGSEYITPYFSFVDEGLM